MRGRGGEGVIFIKLARPFLTYASPRPTPPLHTHSQVPVSREDMEAALRELAKEDVPVITFSRGMATVTGNA